MFNEEVKSYTTAIIYCKRTKFTIPVQQFLKNQRRLQGQTNMKFVESEFSSRLWDKKMISHLQLLENSFDQHYLFENILFAFGGRNITNCT